MKVKFSLKTSYTPDFNGNEDLPEKDRITVDLTPMDNTDLITLADALQAAGMEDGEVDTSKADLKKVKALLDEVGDIVPRYATFHNLQSDDGVELTAEHVVKYPYFQELAFATLLTIANRSQPTEDDAGN